MNIGQIFPSKYLKAEELEEDMTLTIRGIELEEMETKDRGMQKKPVIYFQEIKKGLVLNKTNASIIAKQHSDDTDAWIGQKITLTTMDVEAFGDVVSAIRVRPPRKAAVAKTALIVPGIKSGTEVEHNQELINKYWTTVKALGLNTKKGLEILQGAGGDFETAIRTLESDTPF